MKLKDIVFDKVYKILVYLYDRFFNSFKNNSYSQEGEDLVLQRIFSEKKTGFYIDIGAHHPKRFSNTYFFYKKGWRGINIEPKPGSKNTFDKIRPRDINIEAAISAHVEKLTYYMFSEPALNTFLQEKANILTHNNISVLIRKLEIQTTTLKQILDKYLPDITPIDFLSIDTEGLDFDVLKSNDWDKYKPRIILAEDKDFTIESPQESDIYKYLSERGYRLISKTFKTLIFQY